MDALQRFFMHAYSKFDLLIVICHGGANEEVLVVQKKELA